jgi:GTPase SAR1 family protein
MLIRQITKQSKMQGYYNPQPPCMLEFILSLQQRYQLVLDQQGNQINASQYQQRIDQLLLAEAFLRKGKLLATEPKLPLQIAVIGPTQAGKSSLVNVLLNSPIAGVSPLAGYTVHPQGFCNWLPTQDCQSLQRYFGRFQQLSPAQLTPDRFDCYSLAETPIGSANLPPCVVWDSPDFDSIDAANYREGVLRTVALADVIILVVSKEKYADQSVWDAMSAIETLNQPTLIFLNKLVEGSESVLIRSLQEKWQQTRSDAVPEIMPLHYQKQLGLPVLPEHGQELLQRIAKTSTRKKQARLEQEYLQKYWSSWLEPVLAEHQALQHWHDLIDQSIEQALLSYQQNFLDHPHHYETFQYALAELLNLLEIPGLAGVLTSTRKILTWPVRQMMKLGRKRLHLANSSHELALLKQIAEHLLIQLADHLLDETEQRRQNQWWQQLSSVLRNQKQRLLHEFDETAKSYHVDFQQDVESAAHRLYQQLQKQPLALNSLRATRVTADAAAIALALNTGGVGLHDLIIAPAMFTVTSLLTESAIGSYMGKVERELKQQQLNTVRQTLFINCLRENLKHLPATVSSTTNFNISPEQLQAAEAQLKEKRHGLRLL